MRFIRDVVGDSLMAADIPSFTGKKRPVGATLASRLYR
jgi:hypothetical protein